MVGLLMEYPRPWLWAVSIHISMRIEATTVALPRHLLGAESYMDGGWLYAYLQMALITFAALARWTLYSIQS